MQRIVGYIGDKFILEDSTLEIDQLLYESGSHRITSMEGKGHQKNEEQFIKKTRLPKSSDLSDGSHEIGCFFEASSEKHNINIRRRGISRKKQKQKGRLEESRISSGRNMVKFLVKQSSETSREIVSSTNMPLHSYKNNREFVNSTKGEEFLLPLEEEDVTLSSLETIESPAYFIKLDHLRNSCRQPAHPSFLLNQSGNYTKVESTSTLPFAPATIEKSTTSPSILKSSSPIISSSTIMAFASAKPTTMTVAQEKQRRNQSVILSKDGEAQYHYSSYNSPYHRCVNEQHQYLQSSTVGFTDKNFNPPESIITTSYDGNEKWYQQKYHHQSYFCCNRNSKTIIKNSFEDNQHYNSPIVCGHNVNLSNSNPNSDKIAPTAQQQFHQHHHNGANINSNNNGGNINNIRRDLNLNSRLSNFGNGFTNADDDSTRQSNSETSYSSFSEMNRQFTNDDILDVSSTNDNNNNNSNNDDRNSDGNSGGSASSTTYLRSGCHSCQLREKVKADNLASIKRHILYRLKLKDVPNITAPVVPPEIVEKFYKSHYQNSGNNGGSGNSERGRGANNKNQYSDDDSNGGGGGGSGGQYSSTFYDNDNMQGDDPRAYYDTNYDGGDASDSFSKRRQYTDFSDNSSAGDDDDYEEDFFSVVNSIYVFPTTQHTRHNRKTDVLHFPFTNNGRSTVSQATLHIFIRSWSWIRDHLDTTVQGSNPNIGGSSSSSSTSSQNSAGNRNLDIILKINCVLRHANITHMQKGNEIRHRIPRNDNGIWITVDVTDMVTEWYNNASTNHGVVIKTKEQWMKQFVVLDDSVANKTYAPYIEVMTKDNRKRRTKRNTSLNCSESDNEVRCCRYPLEVNFRHFNWEWIIAPQSFNAYFCNGECKLGFLPKYPHTHLMQMSTAPQPCCSPTKMSPVTLLYFNNEYNLVMSTIPNMAVDKCSCS
ncbi:unnamed protein product [Hermetia illucens]|uniref:TGF-beta family profile domain-containing protein n=1 Tax=Hermetia illucens TaxID=343691 RepID=A0A7R8V8T4_HERIL|nr:unnamed protein product [Hermetia illucens]